MGNFVILLAAVKVFSAKFLKLWGVCWRGERSMKVLHKILLSL